MSQKTILKRMERQLPVELTADEKISAGLKLAEHVGELRDLEDRLANIRSEFKAEREGIEASIAEWQTIVSRGERVATVEVEIVLYHDEGIARTIRMDTGGLVEARPMTREEFQMPLDFVGEPPKPETDA